MDKTCVVELTRDFGLAIRTSSLQKIGKSYYLCHPNDISKSCRFFRLSTRQTRVYVNRCNCVGKRLHTNTCCCDQMSSFNRFFGFTQTRTRRCQRILERNIHCLRAAKNNNDNSVFTYVFLKVSSRYVTTYK